MVQIPEFDYDSVEEILTEAEIDLSAAEVQAILCGMIAGGLNASDQGWQNRVSALLEQPEPPLPRVSETLQQLFDWTEQVMESTDSLPPMLLPDDSYPVIDQLEAIIVWCQGFLLGFGLQIGDAELDSDDLQEALKDLSEISQLSLEADDDEETQTALFTVIEHIRVAVEVVHWEIVVKSRTGEQVEATPANQTIH